jgi:sugar/nucleoside kinase (ribokinase family)
MVSRVVVCGDVINDVLVETRAELVAGADNPAAIRVRPGGSAANQAAWLASLGVPVVFAGRAGAADADFHRRELARHGIEVRLAADEAEPTGVIVVLIGADGDRTMITDRGANLSLRAEDVPPRLLDGAALLHLTGYSFFDPGTRDVIMSLLDEARRGGVPFTIDPGSAAFLDTLEPGEFLEWTRGAAVCFPNLDEAATLTGATDPAVMSATLAGTYGAVVVKLGADGALCATADSPPVRVPARPAVVRDTTGAGDAFVAGFLAAWLNGAPPKAATEAAVTTAARAVATLGGRPVQR